MTTRSRVRSSSSNERIRVRPERHAVVREEAVADAASASLAHGASGGGVVAWVSAVSGRVHGVSDFSRGLGEGRKVGGHKQGPEEGQAEGEG